MLVALVCCLLFGALMRPWVSSTQRALEEESLLRPSPARLGDDALSQQLAFFALGGLRSLAAQFLSLDATVAWSEGDWRRVEQRYEQMTTLCPDRVSYWLSGAYEMWKNAASSTSFEGEALDDWEQSSLRRRYFLRGERFLKDGISHHPDSVVLHTRLGDLYADLYRYPRFLKASEAYAKAVELGASSLTRRSQFYSLCRVYGKEREAWELGREIFASSEDEHVPSLVCLLFALENKLDLPQEQRLSHEQLFRTKKRALRLLKGFEKNTLRYPTYGVREYIVEP